jgi:hypothetical protein
MRAVRNAKKIITEHVVIIAEKMGLILKRLLNELFLNYK